MKWQVEPNPYDGDYDVYITDSDGDALEAVKAAAEQAWDTSEPGGERIIKIRLTKEH